MIRANSAQNFQFCWCAQINYDTLKNKINDIIAHNYLLFLYQWNLSVALFFIASLFSSLKSFGGSRSRISRIETCLSASSSLLRTRIQPTSHSPQYLWEYSRCHGLMSSRFFPARQARWDAARTKLDSWRNQSGLSSKLNRSWVFACSGVTVLVLRFYLVLYATHILYGVGVLGCSGVRVLGSMFHFVYIHNIYFRVLDVSGF